MAGSVIAAQMYTLRDFTKSREDLEKTFKKVADIGYEAVQLSAIGVELPAAEMKALLDKYGLTCCATHHVGFNTLRDNPEQEAEYHRIIGCEWIATGGWEKDLKTEQDWVGFAREASAAAQQLAPLGLHYGYHNHSHEFEKFGKRTAYEILVEESDPQYVTFELDTYWVQHGGASPVWWMKRLNGRLKLLHLKDMTMHGREQFMAEIGEGNLDWEGILATAREIGVQWYIVEQDTCERDPFESLEISFNNLKKMGLE